MTIDFSISKFKEVNLTFELGDYLCKL